ncbi:hypothetical protein HAX54_017504 [Datura stramonium]|uniref:Uncharacterized protein n=1 Tax=Datura stramonium TaxID=4076 RepID=A0ABS8S2U6_DATST|nr:hypothetical protein [Datura stramonium]
MTESGPKFCLEKYNDEIAVDGELYGSYPYIWVKEPGIVRGPTLTIAERHVRDERFMAYIYGMMDLLLRIRGILSTPWEHIVLVDLYPLNTYANSCV